jgi:hypothetical protein
MTHPNQQTAKQASLANQKAPDLTPPVKSTGVIANGGQGEGQRKEAKPKKEKDPNAPKAERQSALRKTYPDTAVITITTPDKKNPKRQGSASYDRFAAYKDGMTVKDAVAAGVLYADLSWDVGHGFISVSAPPATAA